MKPMTVGSLFSGVGGLDMGLEKTQCFKTIWQVEYDKYARSVLRKNWPDTQIYEDVRSVGGENDAGRHVLERPDLIHGGFPCQDLSVAGNRKGLAGERSGLWNEFHRILSELTPTWCIIENVPGLFSSNQGKDFAFVLRGLEELGFSTQWRVLDSRFFGVPQRRRRVFIVGYSGDGPTPEVFLERQGLQGNQTESEGQGEGDSEKPRRSSGPTDSVGPVRIASTLYQGGGFSNYKPSEVASTQRAVQHKGTDVDLVVPLDLRNATRTTEKSALNRQGVGIGKEGDPSPTLCASDVPGLFHHKPPTVIDRSAFNAGKNAQRDPYIEETETMPTLIARGPHAVAFQQNDRHEVRLVGGDGQTAGSLLAQPGAKLQNYISSTETHHDTVAALLASGAGTSRPGSNAGSELTYYVGTVPRRLTPKECERLQGFPDNHTAIGITDAGVEVPISDAQRYKQCGNAVTVNVAQWIGCQIAELDY